MFTLHCKPLYAPTDITLPNAYPTLARLHRHTHQPCLIIKPIPWGKSDRAKKYADYLWVLGGELIRRVSTDEKARKLPARTLILKHIDETGGPLWRHARDEQEHAVYDAVCRRFYQFLTGTKS